MKDINKIIYAGLLHDIGKLFQRADHVQEKHAMYGAKRLEEILDNNELKEILRAIKYHHARELVAQNFKDNDISYLICEADNIASAGERREIESEENKIFKWNIPLDSIFNVINYKENDDKYSYELNDQNDTFKLNMPKQIKEVSQGQYFKLSDELKKVLKIYNFELDTPNSLIYILKNITNFVPSSTNVSEFADISLFEHLKLTAGIASCMYLYTQENNINNYKERYLKNIDRNQKEYLIASLELSGIQKFIYTITSTGAAKMLKARSFYLEILMENIIDEILEDLELSRANLIYNGGGHCYLLLPNTKKTEKLLNEAKNNINNWFIDKYNSEIYLSIAVVGCCANDFNGQAESVNTIFSKLAKKTTKEKLQRYNKEQLQKLLTPQNLENQERECSVCSDSNKIIYNEDLGKDICISCDSLYKLGDKLTKATNSESRGVIITISENEGFLELPSIKNKTNLLNVYANSKEIESKEYCRVYTINQKNFGGLFATNINTVLYGIKGTFEDYANRSIGIKRLGILRADVDNLGKKFKYGLINEKYKDKLVTLSRYSVLSNSLSDFFKYNMNYICSNESFSKNSYKITNKSEKGNIKVIYSGGDDLFFVGAWDEVLEIAMIIDTILKEYTNGKIKISAGFAMVNPNYPISILAELVGNMESIAKDYEGKNAIRLFDEENGYTIKFDDLKGGVLEKLNFLENNISLTSSNENKILIAISSIYRLLEIAKEGSKVKLAYMLGRLEEAIPRKNVILKEQFNDFKVKIYDFFDNEKDKEQLIIALNILIYKNRE